MKLPGIPAFAPLDADEGDVARAPRHWAREKFIPIRSAELAARLEEELEAAQREPFRHLCGRLASVFHHEFFDKLRELKNDYAPFDPDADTLADRPLSAAEQQRRVADLFDKFAWLLGRANFTRLTSDDIRQALAATSDWGVRLKVDLSVFDRLEVFARGDVLGRRVRRRWRNVYRRETVELPIYQRLVVIFRLRPMPDANARSGKQAVHIKSFKNIPKVDLEMLLPGSKVTMTLFDQGKIFVPTISGVAMTGWKLFQGAMVAAVTGIYGLLTYLGLIAATLGYGIKSFFGYLRTQQKYQLNLTRSLYYQNLDNNAGVLFRLLDEAEEQECREAVLAYFFLWRRSGAQGWPRQQLDAEIEAYILREAGVSVDFEVGDALAKLVRLGLVENAPEGRLRAVTIERALPLLDGARKDEG